MNKKYTYVKDPKTVKGAVVNGVGFMYDSADEFIKAFDGIGCMADVMGVEPVVVDEKLNDQRV